MAALCAAAAAGCITDIFVWDDECDEGEARCDGQLARNCDVKYSDAHKAGNPYVWRTSDCGRVTLCAVVRLASDSDANVPLSARCLLQPDPLPECSTDLSTCGASGFSHNGVCYSTCVGDYEVECTVELRATMPGECSDACCPAGELCSSYGHDGVCEGPTEAR
jgi:hypothetical protein